MYTCTERFSIEEARVSITHDNANETQDLSNFNKTSCPVAAAVSLVQAEVYTHVYLDARVHACMFMYARKQICTFMPMCTYMWMCACICVYM